MEGDRIKNDVELPLGWLFFKFIKVHLKRKGYWELSHSSLQTYRADCILNLNQITKTLRVKVIQMNAGDECIVMATLIRFLACFYSWTAENVGKKALKAGAVQLHSLHSPVQVLLSLFNSYPAGHLHL